MRIINFFVCVCFLVVTNVSAQTNFCGIKNSTTQHGEEITYTIYYAFDHDVFIIKINFSAKSSGNENPT